MYVFSLEFTTFSQHSWSIPLKYSSMSLGKRWKMTIIAAPFNVPFGFMLPSIAASSGHQFLVISCTWPSWPICCCLMISRIWWCVLLLLPVSSSHECASNVSWNKYWLQCCWLKGPPGPTVLYVSSWACHCTYEYSPFSSSNNIHVISLLINVWFLPVIHAGPPSISSMTAQCRGPCILSDCRSESLVLLSFQMCCIFWSQVCPGAWHCIPGAAYIYGSDGRHLPVGMFHSHPTDI